jgi:membrane-bound metal-dependent hydrolase YbcI (DUF457 family)
MNTVPTHLVVNAAIEKKYGARFKLARSGFLWGSVSPDFALFFLSIGYFVYYRYFTTQPIDGVMNSAFNNLYFNNPLWIAGHNFLHSPTALIIYAILLWRFVNKPNTRGHWWLSFVFGCMVHSVVDILTHYDDGPVLFWPFEWHIRFYSPVSYWDKAHYASQFFWVELGINVVLLGFLFLPKLIQRLKTKNKEN